MSSLKVDPKENEFFDTLLNGSEEELSALKAFIFRESIRLENERRELKELKESIIEERKQLRKESDEINHQIVIERKRLREEMLFFDKKMDILKNGFAALDADRCALNNARSKFLAEKNSYQDSFRRLRGNELAVYLFQGINNVLTLKKRYKDLLKIFHPDNMGGDHEMIIAINEVYEDLRRSYEGSKII